MAAPGASGLRPLPMLSIEDAIRALQDAAARLGDLAIVREERDTTEEAALFVHTTDGRTLTRR